MADLSERRNRILNSEFRCPKCGGFTWGTSNATEPFAKWIGHCHNFSCDFRWKRSTDDWRCFVFTIRPTRKEYPKLRALDLRERNRRNKRSSARVSTATEEK